MSYLSIVALHLYSQSEAILDQVEKSSCICERGTGSDWLACWAQCVLLTLASCS